MKRIFFAAVGIAVTAVTTVACSSSGVTTAASTSNSSCRSGTPQTFVSSLPGYQVCLFAANTSSYSHPDSIVADGQAIYVGYQNITAKDGADKKTSTIIRYDQHGTVVRKFIVPGHQDGMRVDPITHLLWSMSNEDGSPALVTIDPQSGKVSRHALPATPHGGGFDDIAFVGGMAFIDASNPTLNAAGNNVFPALDKITLTAGSATLTPVLMGNAKANSIIPPVKPSALNLVDPDSMTIDPQGDLVMANQGGSQLVFLHSPGTPQQTVTQLPVGTQIDETVFPSSASGCLVVADNGGGIYSVCSRQFVPGTAYTDAPNDSGVQGFIGTVALGSGFISPLVVGLANPHGMAFVPGVSSL